MEGKPTCVIIIMHEGTEGEATIGWRCRDRMQEIGMRNCSLIIIMSPGENARKAV